MNISKLPIRLILSVIAGIAISMTLSALTHFVLHLAGLFPPSFEPMFETRLVAISLICHSVYAVIGAFVTAWLAREKARRAVVLLGTKEAIMWLLGIILLWHHSPPWFNVTKALLGMPLALLGGWLYKRYKEKNENQK